MIKTLADISPVNQIKQCHNQKAHLCSDACFPSDDEILDMSKAVRSNYYAVFGRFPNLIYYLQSLSLPSVNNRKIQTPLPATADYNIAGHKEDYDELTLNFYADERMTGYFSLLKWIRENEHRPNIVDTISTLSIVLLDNSKNPIIRIDFPEVFCTSLGTMDFENQSSDTLTYYATFAHYSYTVRYLDGSMVIPID